VTDADVKAEYDKFAAANAGKEYRARHILVEKEAQAKDIIARLKKGAKFEDLAKKLSKDPGSGANGGDLDWANPNGYVKEFADALVSFGQGQNHRSAREEPVWLPRDPLGRHPRRASCPSWMKSSRKSPNSCNSSASASSSKSCGTKPGWSPRWSESPIEEKNAAQAAFFYGSATRTPVRGSPVGEQPSR